MVQCEGEAAWPFIPVENVRLALIYVTTVVPSPVLALRLISGLSGMVYEWLRARHVLISVKVSGCLNHPPCSTT